MLWWQNKVFSKGHSEGWLLRALQNKVKFRAGGSSSGSIFFFRWCLNDGRTHLLVRWWPCVNWGFTRQLLNCLLCEKKFYAVWLKCLARRVFKLHSLPYFHWKNRVREVWSLREFMSNCILKWSIFEYMTWRDASVLTLFDLMLGNAPLGEWWSIRDQLITP